MRVTRRGESAHAAPSLRCVALVCLTIVVVAVGLLHAAASSSSSMPPSHATGARTVVNGNAHNTTAIATDTAAPAARAGEVMDEAAAAAVTTRRVRAAAASCNVVAAATQTLASHTSLPLWRLRGDGFHMQLEVSFPLWVDDLRVDLTLPRAFFLDVAEVEQRYTVQTLHAPPSSEDATPPRARDADYAKFASTPVKSHYHPLRVQTTYAFDIEAPAFVVPYANNNVTLTLQLRQSPHRRRGGRRERRHHPEAEDEADDDDDVDEADNLVAVGDAIDGVKDEHKAANDDANHPVAAAAARGRDGAASAFVLLSLPIHVRYEMVDRYTPFSLARLLTYEDAYVRRCLGHVVVQWRSRLCGDHTRASSGSVDSDAHCIDVPVGVLADLPFVYFSLVALMLIALLVVLVAV